MRGHDQTNRRVPSRAWSGLILVSALASLLALAMGSVHGQEAFEPEPLVPRTGEPIDLAAQSMRVWDAAGARWIHLVGRVAILQGVDGVRADQALVRIATRPMPGGSLHSLEVYAEGITPGAGALRRGREARRSFATQEVRLRPYAPMASPASRRHPPGWPSSPGPAWFHR